MRAAAWLALALVGACDWSAQRMVRQPRCERDEATAFFSDGNCNQVPPDGVVVWRGARAPEPAVATPPTPTRALLERGRNRFDVFCAPCHGLVGDGRSQVAENMLLRPPPSLHERRIVALSDAYLYQVVSAGYGLMPGYGQLLPPADRWAVVAYVRVLERSQNVPLAELPPERQKEAPSWPR